jgi:hypothetical protein
LVIRFDLMWVYCEDDDDGGGWVCKFSQGHFNSFVISLRMRGKVCDVRREYVGICEKILRVFSKPAGACQGLGIFESLQDVTQD